MGGRIGLGQWCLLEIEMEELKVGDAQLDEGEVAELGEELLGEVGGGGGSFSFL